MRQNPEIEAAELKGELLLLNSTTNKFFVMNPTAAFIWEKLAEPVDEQQLVSALCERFNGATTEQARADVEETLKNMQELGLVLD